MNKTLEIFPWNDNFAVGIPEIDAQHKKLVQLLNELASNIVFYTDSIDLNKLFNELTEYAVYHFQLEEKIWYQYLAGDTWEAAHKGSHESFVSDVAKLKGEEGTKPLAEILEDILVFLSHWLAYHILESDKRIAMVTLAVQSGMSIEQAKQKTHEEMSGATGLLIDTVLSMYDTVATRTLQLMKTEQASNALIRRNQLLMQSTPEGVHILDEHGKLIEFNEAFSRHLGYTSEELSKLSVYDFEAQMPPERIQTAIKELLNGHAQFETKHRRKNGTLVDVEVIVSGVEIDGVKCLFVLSRDITDRKKAYNDSLRHKVIIETTRDGFWRVDNQGFIREVNQSYAEMLGYTIDEMVAMHVSQIDAYERPEDVKDRMGEVIAKGSLSFNTKHKHRDGHLIDIEVSVAYLEMTSEFVAFCRDVTERNQKDERIHQLAYFDTLTSLPNRRMLNDRLSHALALSKRTGHYAALMFIDLDNFKPLNDTHGHGVGDLLLMEVAHRLIGRVREMDTVARFGGDEFVVILGELEEGKAEATAHVTTVAEKILETLREPYEITIPDGIGVKQITHICSASIGIAMFVNHEVSIDDILKQSDTAMYQAKDAGRNMIRFYGTE